MVKFLSDLPVKTFVQEHLKFYFIVGMFDGDFFGVGIGLASFTTILLISLFHAIHDAGPIVDAARFNALFLASTACGLLMASVLILVFKDPAKVETNYSSGETA